MIITILLKSRQEFDVLDAWPVNFDSVGIERFETLRAGPDSDLLDRIVDGSDPPPIHGDDLWLKAAVLEPGFVTAEVFDRVVDPARMAQPVVELGAPLLRSVEGR